MKLSIVVRARNEAEHLPRLIYGLSQQTLQPDEVVLVDSGSNDETVKLAMEAGWKVCHIDPEHFTFGKSLNIGCEAATGDILVFMSAHVYPVRKDYLENLTRDLNTQDRTVVYGRQVGDSRTKFSERMIMEQWFPSERITDQGHAFTNNANSCVPRALWEELRFNEQLTGLEDIEFTLRVLETGGEVRYANDAPIVHVHEERLAVVKNRYRREAIAYRLIFPGETMHGSYALRLFFRNVYRDFSQARKQHCLNRYFFEILGFRAAQFLGAYSGFRAGLSRETDLLRRMYHPTDSAVSGDRSGVNDPKVISYEEEKR